VSQIGANAASLVVRHLKSAWSDMSLVVRAGAAAAIAAATARQSPACSTPTSLVLRSFTPPIAPHLQPLIFAVFFVMATRRRQALAGPPRSVPPPCSALDAQPGDVGAIWSKMATRSGAVVGDVQMVLVALILFARRLDEVDPQRICRDGLARSKGLAIELAVRVLTGPVVATMHDDHHGILTAGQDHGVTCGGQGPSRAAAGLPRTRDALAELPWNASQSCPSCTLTVTAR
jgi:hypothetical protein